PVIQGKSQWRLDGVVFSRFTIITGLNTVGKTRTCNVIKNTMRKLIEPLPQHQFGKHNIVFKTSADTLYQSVLEVRQDASLKGRVVQEQLKK
ncbi:MAG TPA: hypothetical protein VLZ07_09725, partial [Syntrophales bacterium]|nr:hypothetical protein [Syntrophales bacterium]